MKVLENLFKPDLWEPTNFKDGQVAFRPSERLRLDLGEARKWLTFHQHRGTR